MSECLSTRAKDSYDGGTNEICLLLSSWLLGGRARSVKQFVAYASVSVFVTCVDLLVLRTMLWLNLPQPVAVTIAFCSANAIQFSLYRYVVFRATHHHIAAQGAIYLISLATALILTVSLVAIFSHFLGLSTMVAKICTIPIIFPLGFLASRYLIFRKESQRRS